MLAITRQYNNHSEVPLVEMSFPCDLKIIADDSIPPFNIAVCYSIYIKKLGKQKNNLHTLP